MIFSRAITVVGAHAEGEVGRVVTGGVLAPPGETLLEQQRHLARHEDGLRKLLLYEPRGGAFTHANLVVPARDPRAQAGFIIMEPDDYPPMSGSNSMCVATALLETGMVAMGEPRTQMVLETPGGLVEVDAECREGRCERVTVTNVPCFATHLDHPLNVEGLGELRVDVAYGGAFFVIVDAGPLGFEIVRSEARALVEAGERIKQAAQARIEVAHPEIPGLDRIAFTEFTLPVREENGTRVGRNTVVISPGKLDRSPCGTGTSARLAALHAKGEIGAGERLVSRSVIGSEFAAEIAGTTAVGNRAAIVPRISGRAWITGFHTYVLDPRDPFPEGYTLSDTWYRALD